nr:DUF3667 domain-containing protein [Stenotrophomonas geniculata]
MSSIDSAHAACENCDTALHGHYCHRCGQSAHNPLKHVGHAIEEVFESFWHLDGRIFRTLRDLWVPGRIALNYLKGRRVGYVQPLRLFVILTCLRSSSASSSCTSTISASAVAPTLSTPRPRQWSRSKPPARRSWR